MQQSTYFTRIIATYIIWKYIFKYLVSQFKLRYTYAMQQLNWC